jgi:hypothetical protein
LLLPALDAAVVGPVIEGWSSTLLRAESVNLSTCSDQGGAPGWGAGRGFPPAAP